MKKKKNNTTILVNLTKEEIEAVTCQYLKGCSSGSHYSNRVKAQAKMLNGLKQIKGKV